LTLDADNEQAKELLEECAREISYDETLPDDHPLK
jgi:hypothetical protein